MPSSRVQLARAASHAPNVSANRSLSAPGFVMPTYSRAFERRAGPENVWLRQPAATMTATSTTLLTEATSHADRGGWQR